MIDTNQIFNELKELANNSYSPYSKFRVSCILYLKNGQKIVGVNVENAAYNPGICAERCALPQLYAQGYNKDSVEVMALYTDSTGFGSPCGTCRQTMAELLNQDQKLLVFNKEKFLGEFKVLDFLPYPFTSDEMKEGKK